MGLLRRIRAILEQSPSERDPRDVVIEQQDREISRLRDELASHKGVHRQNGGLQRQIERLERENEHLKQQLGAERRAGRRQAAPFAKKRPQGRGGHPGRRPGARYGRQGRRPCPARVDETIAAPAPTNCPDCGGAVEVTGAASQYQEDLPPVRPLVRRFDIEVGHCSQCRRRIQGRHALQTSDALGAARAQLGPGVVALVVELHTHGGLPLAKVADLLQTRFGLQVTPGGLANLLHRAARDARPAYEALREQVRNAPVVTADVDTVGASAPAATGFTLGGRHPDDDRLRDLRSAADSKTRKRSWEPTSTACSCATGGWSTAASICSRICSTSRWSPSSTRSRQAPTAGRSCSRRPSACTGWSRRSPGA